MEHIHDTQEHIDIPHELVMAVQHKLSLFPEVVIGLADARVATDPQLDRLEIMREYRNALNGKIGLTAVKPEMVE